MNVITQDTYITLHKGVILHPAYDKTDKPDITDVTKSINKIKAS